MGVADALGEAVGLGVAGSVGDGDAANSVAVAVADDVGEGPGGVGLVLWQAATAASRMHPAASVSALFIVCLLSGCDGRAWRAPSS